MAANLRAVKLNGANSVKANMMEANLISANLSKANLPSVNLKKANLHDPYFEPSQCQWSEKIFDMSSLLSLYRF